MNLSKVLSILISAEDIHSRIYVFSVHEQSLNYMYMSTLTHSLFLGEILYLVGWVGAH